MFRLRVPLLAFMLVVAASASGCGGGRLPSPFQNRSGNDAVTIVVDNHNFMDVHVFAEGDGGPRKLGDVTGKSTGTFEISTRNFTMTQGLRLRVDAVGSSEGYLSPYVRVVGGEEVLLSISVNISQSLVSVR